MSDKYIRHSKFLSLVLRHKPETIGLTLGEGGWVGVDELLEAMRRHGRAFGLAELKELVATNDKQRFAFSPDGSRIRASQGHSVEVELGYEPAEPPEVLYHGTAERSVEAILREGILRRERHAVHLSERTDTATTVGNRHGRPVVLAVAAGRMHRDGHAFYRSANGVWLADAVPAGYLTVAGRR
jgi:putative RNA 2'-phosphotransferase